MKRLINGVDIGWAVRWLICFWFFGGAIGKGLEAAGFEELQRFSSADAHQGVGVGPDRVYAIGSRSISAHDKITGTLLSRWTGKFGGEWIHLDSAVYREGKLYCSHSNFPFLPMPGSVEIFDAKTLEWQGRHEFENPPGSCTWVDWHAGAWWVCFAHYNGIGGDPRKDHSWTTLVRYSADWQEEQRWRFPKEVLARFGTYSCSGGSWGANDLLYCTGHDAAETYELRVDPSREELILVRILPLNCLGQGIAWDRSEGLGRPMLYAIKRRSREVTVNALVPTEK